MEIRILQQLVDESFQRPAWHGPNLRGSLRGVTAQTAARRPGPHRHSIREIVVHCAYWKYIVRRRLLGIRTGAFPLKGRNWFRLPERAEEKTWRLELRLLDGMHGALRETIASLDPALLRKSIGARRQSRSRLIYGIACHDVYHAGQIQLLKRLMNA